MVQKCKKSAWEIIELDILEEDMLEIVRVLRDESLTEVFSIFAVKTFAKVNEENARNIIKHFNTFGICKECGYEKLEGENVDCPNCNYFNYNLNLELILDNFSDFLDAELR